MFYAHPSHLAAEPIKSYRYAIDPTPGQQRALLSHIGGSRFAFNHLLSLTLANWDENQARKDDGEEVTKDDCVDTGHFGLLRLWSATRDDVAPWWGENGASAYNDAAQRLSRAMTNFYKKRAKVPRYKRRGLGESVRFTNQAVHLTDSHHVKVSRIGEVKTYESTRKLYRHLERGTGRIVAATISRRSGTWFISFSASITALIPTTRAPERVIGIDVGLYNQEGKVWSDSMRTLRYQIARFAWTGDYLDPSTFLDIMASDNGNNQTGWKNAEYDRLIAEAKTTSDPARRFACFQRCEEILVAECPIVPIYFYSRNNLRLPDVKGWYGNLLDYHPLKGVYLDPAGK